MPVGSDDDVLSLLGAIGPVGPRQVWDHADVLTSEAQGAVTSGTLWPDELAPGGAAHGVRAWSRRGVGDERSPPAAGLGAFFDTFGREPLVSIDPIVDPGVFDTGTAR